MAVYRADGVHDALTAGTLVITDDCVFLDDRSGERLLVVWYFDPQNWIWDPSTRELVTLRFGGQRFGDGDAIALGGSASSGGDRPIEAVLRALDWVAVPDLSCITPTVWFASGDMLVPEPDDL